MDPLSQGVLGAAVPQLAARNHIALAGVLGLLAGMAPDLDILIKSDTDPLVFLKFHRQFSHALIFIPIGSFFCALLLYFGFARRRLTFGRTYLYCTLGYATHGLLDACTSYGTQLFWPFSTARIAWHNISIVDPLFTLPILLCVVLAAVRKNGRWSRAALMWAIVYLGFGVVQRERAEAAGTGIAAARGHPASTLEAKPSFGNLLVWKTIYEHRGDYYIDAVRVGLNVDIFAGETVQKLDLARDFPWLKSDSQQARDVEDFRWFSAGYLAKSRVHDNMIVDMRYSMLPNRGDGMWGVILSPAAGREEHVGYQMMRETDPETRRTFAAMVFNNSKVVTKNGQDF
jgi:inner membrane protein